MVHKVKFQSNFYLYGAGDDLGVEVVGQHSVEARLDREGFVEELLVKVLLDVVHENDGDSVVVVLRSTRATHHLKWNHSPVNWSFDITIPIVYSNTIGNPEKCHCKQ